jgi:hypothetical protein
MARARSRPLIAIAPSALLASFGIFWFSDTVADPDLWGHIRFGQDMLRAGSIIRADTYSYRTAGQTWINHEWLSEVIFAGINDRTGPRGLIVFKVFISLLILGLCHAHLRRHGLGAFRSVCLLLLMSIPFRMGLGTIRPQIFTYLFFLLELLLLEKAEEGHEYRLWALPILFAAWVNLHGGVLAGVGTLGLWIAVRLVERLGDTAGSPNRKLGAVVHLGLVGIACGLALLLNPYGAELAPFLLRTATVPRPEIVEWAPLGLISLPGLLYLVLLAIGISGLVGSGLPRKTESIVLFSVMAVLPLVSNRHYPLFALTLVVLAGEPIASVATRWGGRAGLRPGLSRVVPALALAVCVLLIGVTLPRFGCIRVDPFYFPFPARAVALLKRGGAGGNMAVPFDWGEYVIWHLGPRVKVSIDGRRETVYSDEVYRQSRDFARGTGVWNALLKAAPPTDWVLAPNGSPTANLLSQMDGWLPLYQDTCCVIFARVGLPRLGQIVETPVPALPDNGGGLCFPDLARSHEGPAR